MDSIIYILYYEVERKVLQLFDGISKCKEKLTYSSLPSKELSWKMIYLSKSGLSMSGGWLLENPFPRKAKTINSGAGEVARETRERWPPTDC
jgi:hypothetical protein